MEIRVYGELNVGKLRDKVDKVTAFLETGDFQSADVKKMSNGFYRAKLDYTNRLLFQIGRYDGEMYILILEVIHNHAYEKSKFLNGAFIDENKLQPLNAESDILEEDTTVISYINPNQTSFHILDKILSFDNTQEEILHLPAPGIIIGSAGSGKTALTLEKLKMMKGNILYTTLSPYLVENASHLYSSFGYENAKQEVSFLSFYEYLSTISMPKGKEADYTSFSRWISRYTQSHKIKDAYRVFEEIKGVITGSVVNAAYLSLEEYLSLGIKQSIFSVDDREQVYDLFIKYLSWIAEGDYFDSNIVSFELLQKVQPKYDYVVVDEVQDLTNVQLMLILKALTKPSNFVLCGDSNQIVHPNFFSWAQVKTLFYKLNLKANIVRVLDINYRNTPEVTGIANQLLMIKNTRFGSIDKESTYLVIPNSGQKGEVEYLENNSKVNMEMNSKTSFSTRFAVLVLRNEDKPAARKFYSTPLLFSIQEAKGLEYENIILFNTISTYEKEFKELTNGVTAEDLLPENLNFSRAKDKSDKSLEEYKFYVNSLYVGITRAIKNLYVIEANKKHELLSLLGLVDFKQRSSLTDQTSSKDEWKEEARRLELQGKHEQAEAIREQILQIKPVPWTVTLQKDFPELLEQALNPDVYNRKAKDRLFHYIVFYTWEKYKFPLADLKYRAAERWIIDGFAEINAGQINLYIADNLKGLMPFFNTYGVDYRNEVNITPLMYCMMSNAVKTATYLLDSGANIELTENSGRTAFHLGLHNAYLEEEIKTQYFNLFCNRIKPESIKVRVNNKLIKINSHQGEFMILNIMISALRIQHGKPVPAFTSDDFINFYDGLSPQILPENRRKRNYISNILSKNEHNKKGSGNLKLFMRIGLGQYLPHPLIEILIGDNWVNLYDTLDKDIIIKNGGRIQVAVFDLQDQFRKQLTVHPESVLDYNDYWINSNINVDDEHFVR